MRRNKIINLKIATAKARKHYRELALEAFNAGKSIYQTAKELSLTVQTVSNWFRRFSKNKGTLFLEAKRGPAKGKGLLDASQQRKLTKVLTDHTPDQLKFDFALWSSRAIMEYVQSAFGISISRRTARRYMNRLGFTYQCPVRRARAQNIQAVERWLNDEYPGIKAMATAAKAKILWGDETTNMVGECKVRGYSPRGKSPVLSAPDPRSVRCNSISAIGNRGDLFFMFFSGAMNADLFKDFCIRLLEEQGQPVFLIVDNLKVHHAKILAPWFEEKRKSGEFRIFYLPSYSPELNPDEYLNRDVKANLAERKIPRDLGELKNSIRKHLEARKSDPEAVRRLFDKPEVRYAAE